MGNGARLMYIAQFTSILQNVKNRIHYIYQYIIKGRDNEFS